MKFTAQPVHAMAAQVSFSLQSEVNFEKVNTFSFFSLQFEGVGEKLFAVVACKNC